MNKIPKQLNTEILTILAIYLARCIQNEILAIYLARCNQNKRKTVAPHITYLMRSLVLLLTIF